MDPGFHRRGSILGPPKVVTCRGVQGPPPLENFEIQVLGNVISKVLRLSHCGLRSRFFIAFKLAYLLIFYNFFDVDRTP